MERVEESSGEMRNERMECKNGKSSGLDLPGLVRMGEVKASSWTLSQATLREKDQDQDSRFCILESGEAE